MLIATGLLAGAGQATAQAGHAAARQGTSTRSAHLCEQHILRELSIGLPSSAKNMMRQATQKACAHLASPASAAHSGPFDSSCIFSLPPFDVPLTTWLVGYSNVTKLGESALIGPGFTDVVLGTKVAADICNNNLLVTSTGHLDFRGHREFPPARATLLGFGFAPTTATMEITQVSPEITIFSVLGDNPPFLVLSTVTADLTISISNAKVNGTSLPLGPHCRTEHPFRQVLTGVGNGATGAGYQVNTGGPLSGFINIPPFTGCGVSQNLNPLFTASISGPRNYSIITQGPPCAATVPGTCPPVVPVPLRELPNVT